MEKRKYQRIKDGARVIHKIMGVKGEQLAHVLDMGAGGFRLPLKEKLAPGTLLELSIYLSHEKEPFFGLAKIAWQNSDLTKADKGDYYETGIELIRVGLENRKLIIRYINSFLKEDKHTQKKD